MSHIFLSKCLARWNRFFPDRPCFGFVGWLLNGHFVAKRSIGWHSTWNHCCYHACRRIVATIMHTWKCCFYNACGRIVTTMHTWKCCFYNACGRIVATMHTWKCCFYNAHGRIVAIMHVESLLLSCSWFLGYIRIAIDTLAAAQQMFMTFFTIDEVFEMISVQAKCTLPKNQNFKQHPCRGVVPSQLIPNLVCCLYPPVLLFSKLN